MFTLDKETYQKQKKYNIKEEYFESKKDFIKPKYKLKVQKDFIEPQIPYRAESEVVETRPDTKIWIIIGILAFIGLVLTVIFAISREDIVVAKQEPCPVGFSQQGRFCLPCFGDSTQKQCLRVSHLRRQKS